jgi:serine/threonine protein phosphatase 1
MITSLSLNTHGRDFVVGDIHGCFDVLTQALDSISFNPSVDRLISVGDLVDRGNQNMKALHYLQQPWFHAVLGNHDWSHAWDTTPKFRLSNHNKGDTDWAWDIRHIEDYRELSDKLRALPLLIEVETPHGLVGIVHAEIRPTYDSWNEAKERASKYQTTETCQESFFLTGRTRAKKRAEFNYEKPVDGVCMVLSGHNCMKRPTWIGNSLLIDTGVVYGVCNLDDSEAGLTLINITDQVSHYFPVDRETHTLAVNAIEELPLSLLPRITKG